MKDIKPITKLVMIDIQYCNNLSCFLCFWLGKKIFYYLLYVVHVYVPNFNWYEYIEFLIVHKLSKFRLSLKFDFRLNKKVHLETLRIGNMCCICKMLTFL